MADKFNFVYDFKHKPNYRVEYHHKCGYSISSPAIFKSDREAVFAALREYIATWKKSEYNIIVVAKYTRKGLKEVYRRVA